MELQVARAAAAAARDAQASFNQGSTLAHFGGMIIGKERSLKRVTVNSFAETPFRRHSEAGHLERTSALAHSADRGVMRGCNNGSIIIDSVAGELRGGEKR